MEDNQLQASSFKRPGLGPHRGRLNIQVRGQIGRRNVLDRALRWWSRRNDHNESYLMVQFDVNNRRLLLIIGGIFDVNVLLLFHIFLLLFYYCYSLDFIIDH